MEKQLEITQMRILMFISFIVFWAAWRVAAEDRNLTDASFRDLTFLTDEKQARHLAALITSGDYGTPIHSPPIFQDNSGKWLYAFYIIDQVKKRTPRSHGELAQMKKQFNAEDRRVRFCALLAVAYCHNVSFVSPKWLWDKGMADVDLIANLSAIEYGTSQRERSLQSLLNMKLNQ